MADRTATDTIKGYFYQFDYAIVSLLELKNSTDTIVVEGIEDIDVNTATDKVAIQCKYYAKTEYNHSVIAKPIRLMLDHYKLVKNGKKAQINYKLYGFFKSGQSKLSLPIDTDFLKAHFLTYSIKGNKQYHHTKLSLNDADLKKFLSLLTINISAKEYESQVLNITKLLKTQFTCSDFEAQNFYYNNALKVIKEIAVEGNISKRKISKENFIKKINFKRILFNDWFITYKGEKSLFADLRRQYFTALNISPFERLFIIDVPSIDYSRSDLKSLLFTISKKWSKHSQREPIPFCPYIYFNNLPSNELLELKKELRSEQFKFRDGFDFMDADFNPDSIVEPLTNGCLVGIKIINKIEYIDLILPKISKTKLIYQFFHTDPFYNNTNASIKNVDIQIKKITDIEKII